MNSSSGRASSARPSPGIWEDNFSMFFDFDSSVQYMQRPTESASSSQGGHTPNQRSGGIRVSLACIPCRSRHVKCGAEMPNCSRCVQDDKPCFYAKSRRGMRDRNAPRKRASMRDAERENSAAVMQSTSAYPVGSSGPSSNASASPVSSSSGFSRSATDPRRLLDLYYNFFHKAHPFVLPRYYFLARLDSDPGSLKYLLPVMQYIGSLFAIEFPSAELREAAMKQLDVPNLPPNGFTVLAMLLMAIATHGEDEMVRARAILDRAIYLALEIRMNSRTFANMERDPVLSESWRRTYWGLYITDCMFAGTRRASTFILYGVEANVELPCEERDYDGMIPRPRTMIEYDTRDFEDEETIFSSFTYLIDLARISGALLGLDNVKSKDLENAVTNADAMLMNWKLHLPVEKQGVVGKDEEIDELLFQAQNLLQILVIYIHRPLSRLYHSPIETTSGCAPPPPPREATGQEDRNYWLHTKKTLEAAETAINLYALPIPLLQHTPLGICGIALSTLANLSACAYVLSGTEWYRTRDRIRLGLGGLKKFGEVWGLSRKTERETKAIARAVFTLPRQDDLLRHEQAGSGFDFEGREKWGTRESFLGFNDFQTQTTMGALDPLNMLDDGQSLDLGSTPGRADGYYLGFLNQDG